jgi:hypothetical protein
VDTEDGRRWRILPHLLTEVKDISPEKVLNRRVSQKKKKRGKKKSR